jgi:hypothetical protein
MHQLFISSKVDLISEDEEEMVPRSSAKVNRRVIQEDSDEEMLENKEEDGQTPFKKVISAYKMSETPDSPVAEKANVFATPAPRPKAQLGSSQTPASRLGSVHTPASRIGSGLGSTSQTPASRIGLNNRTPATGASWKSGPPSTAASSRSFKQKNAERYAWLEFPKDAQKRKSLRF